MLINFKKNLESRLMNGSVFSATFWLLIYASISTIIVSAIFIFALSYFFPDLYGVLESDMGRRKLAWISSVVIAPFIESILLSLLVIFFSKIIRDGWVFMASALIISMLHSFQSLFLILTVFAFFAFQSYAFNYIYRENFKRAFLIIWFSHALHNSGAILLVKFLKN